MKISPELKIDAHVVKQLGDELITDHEQAILELIKNSFDADADYCSVEIDTLYEEEVNGEVLSGRIVFTDNGDGMTSKNIEDGWLTISFSQKRSKKENSETTVKGRNYQGDKGLGRLSSMRLGRLLRIETYNESEGVPIFVELDWHKFSEGKTLDSVPVKIETGDGIRSTKGTVLEIIGLTDIERWRSSESPTRLQAQLSRLISPWGHLKEFAVAVSIDDEPVEVEDLPPKLHKLSMSEFAIRFDGETLRMSGSVRLAFYRGQQGDQVEGFEQFIKPDNGKSFFESLKRNKKIQSQYDSVSLSSEKDWFLSFERNIDWKDLVGSNSLVSIPGPFEAMWHYIFIKGPALRELEAFYDEKLSNLASTLKPFSGIRLYRDGFSIGNFQGDWVGLSSDQTSGMGFYSLRPENTYGYIYFDGYETRDLKETSDRQGLIENSVYFGFMRLVREVINFSNTFLNTSRRAAADFINESRITDVSGDEPFHAPQAVEKLASIGSVKTSQEKAIKEFSKSFGSSLDSASKKMEEASSDILVDEKVRGFLASVDNDLRKIKEEYASFERMFSSRLSELDELYSSALIISNELETLKSNVDNYYDLAAVGLSASSLAHDINSQIDVVFNRCRYLVSELKKIDPKTSFKLVKAVEHVRTTTRTIAKDISLLNPMLKGRREKLEELSVAENLEEYFDFVRDSLEAKGISLNFIINIHSKAYFNPGKLFQIIDNLVRNSEYWLLHYRDILSELKISVQIVDKGFLYWDSGKGIRPGISEFIFEPFVSDKKDEKSGLGLFIAKSLLKERGGDILLLPDKNEFGRPYIFNVVFGD